MSLWALAVVPAFGPVACTPEHEYEGNPSVAGESAEAYLHNDSGRAVSLTRRALRQLDFQCTEVAEEPGAYLTMEAFGEPESISISADGNLSLGASQLHGPESCGAVMLEGVDGPRLVFWMQAEVGSRTIRQRSDTWDDAAIVVRPVRDGGRLFNDADLLHEPTAFTPTAGESQCLAQPDALLEWDEARPEGWWYLDDVGSDPRDCRRLHLVQGDVGTANEVRKDWHLCVPSSEFPFDVGDALHFSGDGDELLITAIGPGDAPYADPKAALFSGRPGPTLDSLAPLVLTPQALGCAPQQIQGCYGVQVPTAFEVGLFGAPAVAKLGPDAPRTEYFDALDGRWTFALERGARYAVSDLECRNVGSFAVEPRLTVTFAAPEGATHEE